MTRIQHRRDSAANWLSVDPTPAEGELCYNKTTGGLVCGDGTSKHSELPDIRKQFQNVVTVAKSGTKGAANFICSDSSYGGDDSLCIQAALDSGANIVFLLPGMYNVLNRVSVPQYTTLCGSGTGLTTLKLSKSAQLAVFTSLIYLYEYATCKDLTLDGNAWTDQDLDTNGIYLSSYATLQNCEIKEVRQYAAYCRSAIGARIINNISHHTKYPFGILSDNGQPETVWSDGCLMYGNLAYHTDFYTKIRGAKNCRIENNIFIQETAAGGGVCIDPDSGNTNISICNNTFIDHLGTGEAPAINITNDYNSLTKHITVSNNHIIGWYYGIHGGCNDLIIQNNTVEDCKHTGIHLLYYSPCIVQGNNVNCGVYLAKISNVSVKDNTISGPAVAGNEVGSGIFLTNDNASYTTEKNNIFRNKISNCTYGVRIYKSAGTLTTTDILYNDLRYNTTAFTNSSDGVINIANNLGYKTENTGTATIAALGTSIVVNHGLVSAPTKYSVTPSANIGNCWIDTITATQMTIHCSSAPGADTVVSWSVSV